MNTLIAYATKYGSVEKCTKTLAEKLMGNVEQYNLAIVKPKDLSGYDNVIIGGSIYAGRIQKPVTEFCLKNLEVLKQKKIGLFICGMLSDQAEAELNKAFAPELLTIAVIKEFFGGELKFQKINFVERFMVKMVSKMDKSRPAIDTTRDFSTISEETILRFAQVINETFVN
ncbi:flavodoxin domain-containing protein [Desulfosporosinus sp. SB140]|uniref:flavodoxin domain-containing protein n=1 Tax=Desulfosporosinus paludis TaxID=3115649 RepID=UPI00388EF54E